MSHGPGSVPPVHEQKEFPQKKEIMLTPEHDYNDNRERGQIGPAYALPQSLCSKME